MSIRHKVAALVAEFLGTATITLIFLNVKNSSIGQLPLFVSLSLGLSVVAMTFAAYRLSGAQFNPALTLALWTARRITLLKMLGNIAAQMLGGFVAGVLFVYITRSHLRDVTVKYNIHILVAETLGTFLLAFGYSAAVWQRLSVGAVAAATGLAYIVGSIVAQPVSLGILNPAVALGTKAFVLRLFILGPVIGALIGVQLYSLLFGYPRGAVEAGAGTNDLDALKQKVGDDTEVTQTTVTTVKPARKPRSTTAKSGTTKPRVAAKRAPKVRQ